MAEQDFARTYGCAEESVLQWLRAGLSRSDGRLPLFDAFGDRIDPRVVQFALRSGWAEGWFANPMKPDWMVCRLTDRGRRRVTR